MYASPVAYSSSLIPDEWLWLYSLNPMVGVIEGFRWALLGQGEFPGLSLVIGFSRWCDRIHYWRDDFPAG